MPIPSTHSTPRMHYFCRHMIGKKLENTSTVKGSLIIQKKKTNSDRLSMELDDICGMTRKSCSVVRLVFTVRKHYYRIDNIMYGQLATQQWPFLVHPTLAIQAFEGKEVKTGSSIELAVLSVLRDFLTMARVSAYMIEPKRLLPTWYNPKGQCLLDRTRRISADMT